MGRISSCLFLSPYLSWARLVFLLLLLNGSICIACQSPSDCQGGRQICIDAICQCPKRWNASGPPSCTSPTPVIYEITNPKINHINAPITIKNLCLCQGSMWAAVLSLEAVFIHLTLGGLVLYAVREHVRDCYYQYFDIWDTLLSPKGIFMLAASTFNGVLCLSRFLEFTMILWPLNSNRYGISRKH